MLYLHMFLINKKNGKNIRIFKCDIYANACVIMCLSVRRVIVLNRHFEEEKKIKLNAQQKNKYGDFHHFKLFLKLFKILQPPFQFSVYNIAFI